VCRAHFDPDDPSRVVNVAISEPYAEAIEQSTKSRRRSLVAVAGVLAMVIPAGYVVALTLTRPLRRIATATEAFARGETKVNLPVDAGGEIGVVATAIEYMMRQVAAAHGDLEQRAKELEQSRRAALDMLQDVEANRQKALLAEQAAHDQSARTQAILDGATDAIITIHEDGLIASFNTSAERMFGYKAEEVIGKNVKLLMPEPYSGEHDQYLRNYLSSGIPKIIGIGREVIGLRADGTTFPLHLAVSVVTIGGNRLFTGIVRDITRLRNTMQQLTEAHGELENRARQIERFNLDLRRSNDELRQFAYVASHDLQEPLRKVATFCQMLDNEYSVQLDENARLYIRYAVDGAVRMKSLMQDLLDYSRVETQGRPFEPTDADAACAEAIDNLAVAIEESSAQVTRGPLPTIHADRAQLVRLFQNLIGNAIKYRGAEPPRIHVSAEEVEGEWTFRVRDNGIGIDPAYHERIFVIFQRLHARDKYSGTGIGLAVCKRIVERAGGRIWVESAEGAGSEFCFTMPKSVSIQLQGEESHARDEIAVGSTIG
jgi:PAS domain S-box-containing protein